MNAFASPWASWTGLIKDYEEALHNGEESLKGWWNTALGLPYENAIGTIEVEALESHREEYSAELPYEVLVLTCGVDTQDDRLECEVVGWGVGKESWGIEYRVFYGDPGLNEVWQALDDFLLKLWSTRTERKSAYLAHVLTQQDISPMKFINSASLEPEEIYSRS